MVTECSCQHDYNLFNRWDEWDHDQSWSHLSECCMQILDAMRIEMHLEVHLLGQAAFPVDKNCTKLQVLRWSMMVGWLQTDSGEDRTTSEVIITPSVSFGPLIGQSCSQQWWSVPGFVESCVEKKRFNTTRMSFHFRRWSTKQSKAIRNVLVWLQSKISINTK